MGNYWEPIEQDSETQSDAGTYGFVAPTPLGEPAEVGATAETEPVPIHLSGQAGHSTNPTQQGGIVSQYGGPERPTGPGGSGGGGNDDDRTTSPFGEPTGHDPYGSDRQPFGYQEEERYWTDYLRIAAPVLGVILMLALVWFWIANFLDDGDGDDQVASGDDDTPGEVIIDDTPTADENGDAAGDDAMAVTTPEGDEGTAEEGTGDGNAPTSIGPGATVIVVGTGEGGLNVRADATVDAEVVTTVANGAALTVTGEAQEGADYTWWPVDTGQGTGFAAADFLELADEQ